jgi:hypothetical protein
MKRSYLLLTLIAVTLQGCIQHTPYNYGYSRYAVVTPAPVVVRPLPRYETYPIYTPPVYTPPPPIQYRYYEYRRPQPHYHSHRRHRW